MSKIKTLAIGVMMAMAGTANADEWLLINDVNEMDGTGSVYAASPFISPTKPFDFPYGDAKAIIYVGCRDWGWGAKGNFIKINFRDAPSLVMEEKNPMTDIRSVAFRVKWGKEKPENLSLNANRGDSGRVYGVSHANLKKDAIAKFGIHNEVLFEFEFYNVGRRKFFRFPIGEQAMKVINLAIKEGCN